MQIHEKSFDPFRSRCSLLHKRLVGPRFLEARGGIALGRKIRIYATLCVGKINLSKRKCCFHSIEDAGTRGRVNIHERVTKPSCRPVFAHTWGWRKFDIAADGEVQPLPLINDTLLPDIEPKQIFPARKQVVVPPLSYAFFVIAQANAKLVRMEVNELDILMV